MHLPVDETRVSPCSGRIASCAEASARVRTAPKAAFLPAKTEYARIQVSALVGVPMTTKEPKHPLSIRVSPDLKEQLEVEAARFNRKPSEHARVLLADHFAGRSIERVREELTELQSEAFKLREQLNGHTQAVYFVLRLFGGALNLSGDQWNELNSQFKRLLNEDE